MNLDEKIKILCEEGNKCEELKQYDLAINKFEEALDIVEKNELKYDEGWFYIAIGEQYFKKQDLENSLKYYQTAKKHPIYVNNWFVTYRIADILRDCGKYLEAREKYILALGYIKEQENNKNQINDYINHSYEVLRELCKNEEKLGETIKEKLVKYLTHNGIKFKKIKYLKTYENDKKIYYISTFKNGLFDKGKMIIFDGENFVFNEKYDKKTEKEDVIKLLKLEENTKFRVVSLSVIEGKEFETFEYKRDGKAVNNEVVEMI